jgi:hypothetical protein
VVVDATVVVVTVVLGATVELELLVVVVSVVTVVETLDEVDVLDVDEEVDVDDEVEVDEELDVVVELLATDELVDDDELVVVGTASVVEVVDAGSEVLVLLTDVLLVLVLELELVVVVVLHSTQHGMSGSSSIVGAGRMTAEPRIVGTVPRCRNTTPLPPRSVPPTVIVLPARSRVTARGAVPMPWVVSTAPVGTVTSQPSIRMMPP